MKKFFLLFALVFASPLALAADEISEGKYKLRGSNPGTATFAYHGHVTISREGSIYLLKWQIGSQQQQEGTARLDGDLLKVSYRDLSGQDFGIVEYRVVDRRTLEGPWWSHHRPDRIGIERLELE